MSALAAPIARANDVINPDISILGGTTPFGALHTDSFDFTDIFTFSVEGSVLANMILSTTGAGLQNIDFVSADLNGNSLTLTLLTPDGSSELGLLGNTSLTGPLVLTVRGRSSAAGGTFASYSGTLNVASVPEPSTTLLMGLGLAGLGLAARRASVE